MGPTYELPLASNDTARLAQLATQKRPPRGPSVNLTAALGAPSILPGREQEAYEIWRGLCERTTQGDAAAGEDMVMLTMLLANELSGTHQVGELRTLTQAALAAARLPRHKQEQLGRLCRLAIREGDQVAAFEALSAMQLDPPDIESDSELRVSAAATATLLGVHDYVLAVLGERASAVPIDESLQPLAIVLRANAHEQRGQLASAADCLRELPHFAMLADLSATFATLKLCPKSSVGHDERGESLHRNVPAPIGTALTLGVLFLGCTLFVIGVFVLSDDKVGPSVGDAIIATLCVLFMLLLGVGLTVAGVSFRKRVNFLRQHGIARRARVIQIEGTTSRIGNIPIYNLTLELLGPKGSYRARVRKALHAPDATAIVGTFVSILANPSDDSDVILDELTFV